MSPGVRGMTFPMVATFQKTDSKAVVFERSGQRESIAFTVRGGTWLSRAGPDPGIRDTPRAHVVVASRTSGGNRESTVVIKG